MEPSFLIPSGRAYPVSDAILRLLPRGARLEFQDDEEDSTMSSLPKPEEKRGQPANRGARADTNNENKENVGTGSPPQQSENKLVTTSPLLPPNENVESSFLPPRLCPRVVLTRVDPLPYLAAPIGNPSDPIPTVVAAPVPPTIGNAERLRVILRLRPRLPGEQTDFLSQDGVSVPIMEASADDELKLTLHPESEAYKNLIRKSANAASFSITYKVSRVLGPLTNQWEVYKQVMPSLVDTFSKGTHCLIFSFGTTKAGKTYTMRGSLLGEHQGIIPRALADIIAIRDAHGGPPRVPYRVKPVRHSDFVWTSEQEREKIRDLKASVLAKDSRGKAATLVDAPPQNDTRSTGSSSSNFSLSNENRNDIGLSEVDGCEIWVSFLELYQDQFLDCLAPSGPIQRKLRFDKKHCAYVDGMTEIPVETFNEANQVYVRGARMTHKGATGLNESSSRGHCMFIVKLVHVPKAVDSKGLVTRLVFCDLAGQERTAKTGNMGIRLKESGYINLSLMTLRQVLDEMREQKSLSSYRNNKLTRFLHAELESGSTTMLVNVAPAAQLCDETRYVLDIAGRAGDVQTHAVPVRATMAVDTAKFKPKLKQTRRHVTAPYPPRPLRSKFVLPPMFSSTLIGGDFFRRPGLPEPEESFVLRPILEPGQTVEPLTTHEVAQAAHPLPAARAVTVNEMQREDNVQNLHGDIPSASGEALLALASTGNQIRLPDPVEEVRRSARLALINSGRTNQPAVTAVALDNERFDRQAVTEEVELLRAEFEKKSTEFEKKSTEFEKKSTEFEKKAAEFEQRSAEFERKSAEFEEKYARLQREHAKKEKLFELERQQLKSMIADVRRRAQEELDMQKRHDAGRMRDIEFLAKADMEKTVKIKEAENQRLLLEIQKLKKSVCDSDVSDSASKSTVSSRRRLVQRSPQQVFSASPDSSINVDFIPLRPRYGENVSDEDDFTAPATKRSVGKRRNQRK